MAPSLASPPEALSYTPALESSQIVCIEGPGGPPCLTLLCLLNNWGQGPRMLLSHHCPPPPPPRRPRPPRSAPKPSWNWKNLKNP